MRWRGNTLFFFSDFVFFCECEKRIWMIVLLLVWKEEREVFVYRGVAPALEKAKKKAKPQQKVGQ